MGKTFVRPTAVRSASLVAAMLLCALAMSLLSFPPGGMTAAPAQTPPPAPAPSPTPVESAWVTDGPVLAAASAGNTTYIGGDFSIVGPYTGKGIPVDRTTGKLSGAFPKVNGSLRACAPDGLGGWYIGGYFTSVGGVQRNRLAHILPGGTVDPAWDPDANGEIYTLLFSGSTVYVGGGFSTLRGGAVPRNNIAAIDAATGVPTAWDPDANNGVYALVLSGSTLYVGGNFTALQGGVSPRDHLAAIDTTTGVPNAWDPDADNNVWAMAASGSTLYVGGMFTSLQGGAVPRNNLAAVDMNTGMPTAWDPDASNDVLTLCASGSTVYAGGDFTTLKGGTVTRRGIAAIDAATGDPTAWDPDLNGPASAIAVSGATVYVGGSFTTLQNGATTRNHAAAIDAATGVPTAWDPDLNNNVYALAVAGSRVYAGGIFDIMGGVPRRNLAAIDSNPSSPTCGQATAWNPDANQSVHALAVAGSTVYAGGKFTTMQGGTVYRSYLAAIDGNTGVPTWWDPSPNTWVFSLAVSGSTVYAGGNFTTLQSGWTPRNYLAAIDAATGLPTPWNPDPNNTGWFGVTSLTVSGSNVYAGGAFTTFRGGTVARNHIAAIDASTGVPTPWNPDSNGEVNALAVSGSTVYAGGAFTGFRGGTVTRNNIAAIDAKTGVPTAWDPDASNDVDSLAVSGSIVYAGGKYTTLRGGSVNRKFLAAIDAATGVPTAWDPNANNGISALALSGSTVYAGGWYTTIGGAERHYLAAFETPAPTVTSVAPSTGGSGSIVEVTNLSGTRFWGNPTVQLTGPAGAGYGGGGTLTATNVRAISPTRIACTFDLAGAAAGPYSLKVKNPDGKSAEKAGAFTVLTPTWYLAEGTNAWGFSTYVTLENPNAAAVTARLTYMEPAAPSSGKGESATRTVTLPPLSQTTVSSVPDIGETDFSTRVECLEGKSIAVDRTMFWTGKGCAPSQSGYHSSIGACSPSRTWYLPEGSSAWGFESWTLVENPNAREAKIELMYMTEGGGARGFSRTVPPYSRATYGMASDIGEADSSVRVSSDVPVVVEGSTYRDGRREGSCSIGTTTPSFDYYLAEGATGYDVGFTTYVLVQNPQPTPTDVTLDYQTASGPVAGPSFTMAPNSRKTVRLNDTLPADTNVSTRVRGSAPVIAERAMYWDNGTGRAFHASIGLGSPSMVCMCPDGQTSNGWETWTLVANTNPGAVTVRITYLPQDGGRSVSFTDEIAPGTRATYAMADRIPSGRASILVRSLDGARPVMVERSMYRNDRGSGTNTVGACSD